MLTNIVGLYISWNRPKTALQMKWIESATEQSGDYFDAALVKAVQSV